MPDWIDFTRRSAAEAQDPAKVQQYKAAGILSSHAAINRQLMDDVNFRTAYQEKLFRAHPTVAQALTHFIGRDPQTGEMTNVPGDEVRKQIINGLANANLSAGGRRAREAAFEIMRVHSKLQMPRLAPEFAGEYIPAVAAASAPAPAPMADATQLFSATNPDATELFSSTEPTIDKKAVRTGAAVLAGLVAAVGVAAWFAHHYANSSDSHHGAAKNITGAAYVPHAATLTTKDGAQIRIPAYSAIWVVKNNGPHFKDDDGTKNYVCLGRDKLGDLKLATIDGDDLSTEKNKWWPDGNMNRDSYHEDECTHDVAPAAYVPPVAPSPPPVAKPEAKRMPGKTQDGMHFLGLVPQDNFKQKPKPAAAAQGAARPAGPSTPAPASLLPN